MSDHFQFDVFLSHNHADKPRVRKLAERLKAAGVRVWLDEWAIKPGDVIAMKVDEGLERSRVLLLCISPAALASGWVALERCTAVHRDPANAGRRFIPLLLGDCHLPDTLRLYKYVDFREESDAAFAEVLTICRPETKSKPPTVESEVQKKSTTKTPKPEKSPQETRGGSILPLGFRLRESFGRHDKVITRLAWAPDGVRLASAGQDGVIRIWDGQAGSLIRKLVADDDLRMTPQNVRMARSSLAIAWTPAWSSDGTLIACAYGDGAIRLWDSNTGEIVCTLEGHAFKTNNVAWSPDNKRLASSADDGLVKIWDVSSKSCLATLAGHRDGINTIAWHPRGHVLASASLDQTIRLWDTESHKHLRTLSGHNDIVITVTWSQDGKLFASTSGDATIRLWNPQTGSQLRVLEGHRAPVSCISFSSDGKLLASKGIDPDSTVRIWRVGSWDVVASLNEPSGKMWFAGIAFHPTKMVLATLCDDDCAIRIWDLDSRILLGSEVTDVPVRYCSAKVVLLGEGTVGKTSLAHRLIDDRYVVHDRTHGMNVWRLELPLPPDASLEREALLWDLAGQEDYRLIHQLFLEQTALALLLINPQKDDPFVEAGDWLKALNTAANEAEANRETARLLIFSQIDVGGMKLGKAKIDRFREQHGFADWLTTSAKTGENCSDEENGGKPSKLKQLIAANIPWDKLPHTSTPRLLAELKNAVMAMRDESDIRLLRFSELAQRLEQMLPDEKFSEADVRTAVTLLANHGLARPLKFGDLVLLRPDLINGYAGAVIRAARVHNDEIGCALESDIYRSDFDFTGVERLQHRPDEELLLRALVQTFLDHSLCIAEDTPHGRQLVFPSQYRRERDTPKNPNIFVSYTFSGEWQTVWTTLVVRLWYSQEFAHRELWRNAAEFASAKGHTLGLLIRKEGDGVATISLYFDVEVPDELKVLFIEYVHRHLARYACEVARDRRYLCPECRKPVMDLDAVRKRLAANKDFITCQECDEKVPLIDFIEQRLKSDPVARQILTMDEIATRGLDTQALEQILIGHMMAIAGEANQIFRPLTMFDHGIDGEVEFKDNDGKASGKRIYIQLKSGNSYLRTRKGDGREVFDVKDDRHLEYWINQPVDVYLVIRQTDEMTAQQVIRWMNVTRYLKARKDKKSRQIIFQGAKLDMEALWKLRDEFFPAATTRK
jgi:WD40 repeat protein